jgi:hypothetical protein
VVEKIRSRHGMASRHRHMAPSEAAFSMRSVGSNVSARSGNIYGQEKKYGSRPATSAGDLVSALQR